MITPPPGVRTPDRRSGFPVPLPVAPTACGNGKWEAAFVDGRLAPRRSLHPAVPLASHSLVRPRGAFFRPGRLIQKPARTAAVKTGPVQGRRRLGLDGREHDGTLARHGYGRSQLPSMTLDRRAQKPIRQCVPAYPDRMVFAAVVGINLATGPSLPCAASFLVTTWRLAMTASSCSCV